MRFGRERAQRHAWRHEALADLGDRLDLVDRHGLARIAEFEQVAQIDRRHVAHATRELQIGRIAVGADGGLQQMHELCGIGVRVAARPVPVEATDGQGHYGLAEGRFMAEQGAVLQRVIALARDLARHAREEVVDQRAA